VPNSFWAPYIKILPTKYRNMPIFYTEEELKHLKGSFTLDKIEDRKISLRTEYENICRAVPEFRRYTHWEFVWARLVVITRIFGLVIKGTKTDGLVAYADMLNHKIPREEGSNTGTSYVSARWPLLVHCCASRTR
jgi:histone-lysine N-methyltransferase SETD3